MATQDKLPRLFGRKAWEAVWSLESGRILLGAILRACDTHDLGKISFLPGMRFPGLNSRDSVAGVWATGLTRRGLASLLPTGE